MKPEQYSVEVYSGQALPSLRDLIAVPFRQRRIMLISFGLVVLVVGLSGLWVPKYEAQMRILVRRQRSDAVVTASATAPSQMFSDQVSEEDMNSEVELLKSQDLLRRVVITTGLGGDLRGGDAQKDEVKIAKAVRQLAGKLKIESLHKSNIIAISYQSRDPKLSARVLAALSTAYLEKHLEVHRSTGEYKFFDQQMQQYQEGLTQAQAKLTDFTRSTGVVSADVERDAALRQATDFDTAARQAESGLAETKHRVVALQQELQTMKPRVTTVVRTLDNSQLSDRSRSTLLDLELKRTELLTRFAPTYPLVQQVERQIAETKAAISEQESRPIREESSDRDSSYQWVKDELTRSQAELTGLQSRAASAAASAAQYRAEAQRLDRDALIQQDLVRAAKTQEENYLLYVHKREEARISDALDQRGIVNVAVAEPPYVPALPTKSTAGVTLLTLLLAGLFSLGSAFAADYLDPSFRTPDELANYLGAPVLAALSKPGE